MEAGLPAPRARPPGGTQQTCAHGRGRPAHDARRRPARAPQGAPRPCPGRPSPRGARGRAHARCVHPALFHIFAPATSKPPRAHVHPLAGYVHARTRAPYAPSTTFVHAHACTCLWTGRAGLCLARSAFSLAWVSAAAVRLYLPMLHARVCVRARYARLAAPPHALHTQDENSRRHMGRVGGVRKATQSHR